MLNNKISKISNAFSTGAGGHNFEHQIQAMFLLSLLIDGFCPAMNEKTKRINFQAKHLGYDIDDLVVFTYRNQYEGKLLCQIKHSITATKKNSVFQEVICAAWNDYNKDCFNKDCDRIALVTAQISNKAQRGLRFLHEQANASVDELEFIRRINLPLFSNRENKEFLDDIKECIVFAKGSDPTDYELWGFCKAFVLLLFDMDCVESINRALSYSLIKCNSDENALHVWARLLDYVSSCNQTASTIDQSNIDRNIQDLFKAKPSVMLPPSPIVEIDLFIPTIALIGAWKADNEHDRNIIEYISGMRYLEFEGKAKNMLYRSSEYLQLDTGRWKVINKELLLDQCRAMLFDDSIERIIESAKVVLKQKSKQVMTQSFLSYSKEGDYDNSIELRISLLKSLCWIKKTLPELPNCSQERINVKLSLFVNELLKEKWETWASLRDCLQDLAEIAPESYLDRVESWIINKPQEVLELFPKHNSALFESRNYISELLWSLEVLAWSPQYLVRSICALGMLEALPYEHTNWANTPINSIVSILLPWYPQTVAGRDKKINALSCLRNDNPDVFWNALMKLLPNNTTTTSPTPKPKLLSVEIPEKIEVTRYEINEEYAYLLELAIESANGKPEKLVELSNQIGYMYKNTLMHYLESIEKCLDSINEEQCFSIWYNLRKQLALLKPKKGMVVFEQLDRINQLIMALEPENIRLKYRELYLENNYLFAEGDYNSTWEYLENKKVTAIKEIFVLYGPRETEQFGHCVNKVLDVANKLGQSITQSDLSQIINECYLGSVSKEFTVECVSSFVFVNGANTLIETSLSQKDQDFKLDIISKISFSWDLLKVINQLLPNETKYWEKAVVPFILRGKNIEELKYIVENLMACKRYVAAINLVGRSDFEVVMNANDIGDLLILAGTEESIGDEKVDNYSIQRILKWFQTQECISIEVRSSIELIYLPVLDSHSSVQPLALYTRLSLDPCYFCGMLELFYKKSSEDKHKSETSKGLNERLFEILFNYKVTPGVDWNGKFDETCFKSWMNYVKTWSEENDRYVVAMNTVGSGLSYAQLDSEKLPNKAIIEELNRIENNELRRGYYVGVINQRGVHFIDPEGKPELELAHDFNKRASVAENKGYSRYAGVLRKIAEQYTREAEQNIKEAGVFKNEYT